MKQNGRLITCSFMPIVPGVDDPHGDRGGGGGVGRVARRGAAERREELEVEPRSPRSQAARDRRELDVVVLGERDVGAELDARRREARRRLRMPATVCSKASATPTSLRVRARVAPWTLTSSVVSPERDQPRGEVSYAHSRPLVVTLMRS
jgi:hypothetical protein